MSEPLQHQGNEMYRGTYDILVTRRGKRVEKNENGSESIRWIDEGQEKHTVSIEIHVAGIVADLGERAVKSRGGVSKFMGGRVTVRRIR